MSTDYEKHFAGFLNVAADIAGSVALEYFRQPLSVADKDDKSPVTQADREIERRLRDLIGRTFPDHGIIGEEFGKEKTDAEFVWVIDPIDGTKSFITGRPQFGTIIGLLYQGIPTVGLIDQAFTRERWFGIADQFAKHNGTLIKVAEPRMLENARLCTGVAPAFDDKYLENYLSLCRSAKLVQANGECYVYGLLSMGLFDIVIEHDLKIHDVAGVVPIVTGAGGFAGNWGLNPITLDFDGTIVAASSKALAMSAVNHFKP
jgi:histidinol phosphatase-like enzyme (inositol monophosphatase family)